MEIESTGGEDLFADLSNAGGTQSGWSKFFLGDQAKKDAKIEETKANAEMTKAMALLATQMATQPQDRSGSSSSMIWIIGGSVVAAAALIVTVIMIKKK